MERQHYAFGLAASSLAALLTLALAAGTPSTTIPVGIAPAHGDSMAPTLDEGGMRIYVDEGYPNVERGDIIIYRDDGEWIEHRVVAETPQGYVTQGDNVSYTDQSVGAAYVTRENYAGTVVFAWDGDGPHWFGDRVCVITNAPYL